MKLKGSARNWWQKFDTNNVLFDGPHITRWNDMRKKLKDYMWPDDRQ